MDAVEATPARSHRTLPWDDEARQRLDASVEESPVLVRISFAKRLRDAAEREATRAGSDSVTGVCVERARLALAAGLTAEAFSGAASVAPATETPRESREQGGDPRS